MDHLGSGGAGHFANNLAIPGGYADDYVLHATCQLTITAAGTYTFGVNSDDGSRLRIDGANVILDNSLHPPQDRFGTLALTAGVHNLDFVFFERGGGSTVELFAAPGSFIAFDASMKLVGDTPNGGLSCNSVLGTTGILNVSDPVPAGGNVTITVTDPDLNTDVAVAETVIVAVVNQDTGEVEDVTLTETGPDTGVFVGELITASNPATGADNDGTLNVQEGNTLGVSYNDVLDAAGNNTILPATVNILAPIAVPTLSQWGLLLMISLLGVIGIRRKA